MVAAASRLPPRTGRQRNDRMDAERLCRMPGSGVVRCVMAPSIEEEPLCHPSRLRGEAALGLRRARRRVAALPLLTQAPCTLTEQRWTKAFVRWVEAHGLCAGRTPSSSA